MGITVTESKINPNTKTVQTENIDRLIFDFRNTINITKETKSFGGMYVYLDVLRRNHLASEHYIHGLTPQEAVDLEASKLSYSGFAKDVQLVKEGKKTPTEVTEKQSRHLHNMLHSTERGFRPIPLEEKVNRQESGILSRVTAPLSAGLDMLFGAITKKV